MVKYNVKMEGAPVGRPTAPHTHKHTEMAINGWCENVDALSVSLSGGWCASSVERHQPLVAGALWADQHKFSEFN